MTVRAAKFIDIPAISEILEAGHGRSIYKDNGTFDEIQTKQLIARQLQRHGHTNYGGTLCLVSEHEGIVKGFIIGLIDMVYPVLAERMVTDLLFVFAEDAPPRDAVTMVKRLIAWAKSAPKVIEIHLGVTDAIGDWERVGRLYKRLGFTQSGAMFRMTLAQDSSKEQAQCPRSLRA